MAKAADKAKARYQEGDTVLCKNTGETLAVRAVFVIAGSAIYFIGDRKDWAYATDLKLVRRAQA